MQTGHDRHLTDYLNRVLDEFMPALSGNSGTIDYLIACGCATIAAFGNNVVGILKRSYGGLLTSGFTGEELNALVVKASGLLSQVPIGKCIQFSERLQLALQAAQDLTGLGAIGFSPETVKRLSECFKNLVADLDILGVVGKEVPKLSKLNEPWSPSGLNALKLTSTGVALAPATYVRLTGVNMPLSI